MLPPEGSTSFCVACCLEIEARRRGFWIRSILEALRGGEQRLDIVRVDTIDYSAGGHKCRPAFAKAMTFRLACALVLHVPCIGPHGTNETAGTAGQHSLQYLQSCRVRHNEPV